MAGKRAPDAAPDTAAALADLVARSVEGQHAAAEAELAGLPGQVTELSRRLVALDRQLSAAAQRLWLLERRPAAEDFAAEELRRLRAVRGVQAIGVSGSALEVESAPVTLAWEGHRYDLGPYRVVLDLAGDVRVESLWPRATRAAWDHPHVQGGLPCLGNLRAGVLKLIAEYELALAVQVLLDFLGTYNPDTAYTPIEGWPEVA